MQKIRSRIGLSMILMGGALAAFVLTDFLKGGCSSGPDTTVGEVAGEEIDYNILSQKYKERLDAQMQFLGADINETVKDAIMNQVWTEIVNEIMYGKQYEELGLDVSANEAYELFVGPNISPIVIQEFTRGGQPFDVNNVKMLLEKSKQDPQLKQQLKDFEEILIKERLREKFENLIIGAIFVSKKEAEMRYNEDNTKYDFEYIAVSYASINDSTIKVDESELEDYYDEHIESFKQLQAEAKIKYVSFPKLPTVADSTQALDYLKKVKEHFAKVKNDSSFAASKSETPIDTTYKSIVQLPMPLQDYIVNTDSNNKVVGPINNGKFVTVAKITKQIQDSVDYFKVKSILIKPTGNTKEDSAKARSKAAEIESEITAENFVVKVQEHSMDMISKAKGGSMGWILPKTFGKDFEKSIKSGTVGKVIGPLKSPQGYHIVMVEKMTNKKYQAYIVNREVFPGQNTLNDLYRKAEEFANSIEDPAKFEKIAIQKKLLPKESGSIMPSGTTIPGLIGIKPLVKWSLTGEKGMISTEPIDCENAYVVAYLTSLVEEGYKKLEDVKEEVQAEVVKLKKADIIAKKLNGLSGNFNDMREKYGQGAFVSKAQGLTFSAFQVPGIGPDMYLIGKVTTMKKGETSKAIKGTNGVYRVKILNVTQPTKADEKVMAQYVKNLVMQKRNSMKTKIAPALRELAEIKDYRYKFEF